MEIILSRTCKSLTGSLGRSLGYYIRSARSKDGTVRFYGQRSKHTVPPDGHWRFIVVCAEMARCKLHIADIKIHWNELYDALYEAYHFAAADRVGWNGRKAKKIFYNASDILNLKTTFGL